MTECDLVHSTLQLNRYIERFSIQRIEKQSGGGGLEREGKRTHFGLEKGMRLMRRKRLYEKEETEEKRGGGFRAYEKGDLREGRAMSRRSFQADCSWYDCVCVRRTFKLALAYV